MKTIINIEGMSCMHCVAAVKNALENLNGVTAVEVILEKKIAEIEYESDIVNTDDMISAIEEQGFEASI